MATFYLCIAVLAGVAGSVAVWPHFGLASLLLMPVFSSAAVLLAGAALLLRPADDRLRLDDLTDRMVDDLNGVAGRGRSPSSPTTAETERLAARR